MVRYLLPLVWPWTLKIFLQCFCKLRFATETSDCVPKASSDCPCFLHVKSCVKMHLNLSFRWQKFFWFRSCWRSLKMVPFDRPYTTFYWSATVNTAICCTVFELFDVEWYRDLQIWITSLKVIQTGTIQKLGCGFLSPSIVTMALSCISSEIKRDIGRKSWFFHTPLAFGAPLGGSPSEYCHPI